MKIAFLAPGYPLRGGIAQFVAILAEKLINNGHTVKIFSFKKQYPALIFPGKEQIEKSSKFIKLDVDSTLVPYNPLTYSKTIKKINDYKPDVIILKYWIPFFAPAFGYILRKIHKQIKKLYIIDNIDFHEKWPFANLLTKYAFTPANYFISMSTAVSSIFSKKFPQKKLFKLNHPNYDFYIDNNFSDCKNDTKYNILFFGYIKPYKGLEILLESLPFVKAKYPDICLTIAGEIYGNIDIYKDLIDKLNLKGNIDFQDRYIANEEVKLFFEKADVTVLPYKHATQSGIIQLSYAFLKPVIATNVGGIPEVVNHNKTGYIVPPNDPKLLADAIIKFYENKNRINFSKNIFIENKKYSWDPFIETVENL